MKRLNKLQINAEKILKSAELITIRGAYDSGDSSATDKISACAGKGEYSHCCWTWNGMVQYGRCLRFFGGPLHCSDLN